MGGVGVILMTSLFPGRGYYCFFCLAVSLVVC